MMFLLNHQSYLTWGISYSDYRNGEELRLIIIDSSLPHYVEMVGDYPKAKRAKKALEAKKKLTETSNEKKLTETSNEMTEKQEPKIKPEESQKVLKFHNLTMFRANNDKYIQEPNFAVVNPFLQLGLKIVKPKLKTK